ncbi:MAG: aminotransferase class I/II-fold pyridoxal phosphate-dependent enzyme, partial [Gaiellales bacterium]
MTDKQARGFDSRAVHAGRRDLRDLGVHAPPLDMSTTYPVEDLDGAAAQLDAWATGAQPTGSPIYARLHNPTVGRFEDAMAELEGGEAGVAFASGMGAITAVLLALEPNRRHVVAIRPLYGGSDHLLCSGLLGVEVTWTAPEDVAAAIRPDTGLIMLETPQNPTSTLVDIAAVASAAGDVPVLVDNTFATPVLQRPLEHGASIVVHSATKFIGGHGDAMGGIVVCDEAFAARVRGVRIATGAVLHPMAAWHLHRGIATLPLRVRAMTESATQLASRLALHPAVACVHHASLSSTDPDGLVGRQMSGPGSMV